ncbi:uncharacterized protein TM35_000043460 [Trypanosoma theileri]|uniref:Uncharacterized protein n=1 Tax=Trypanosoma theileri TaxID=67003 RepID=A0A1X0P5C9_9TRYP|nr:uncharacterized protein TM35_000043460 [Trypanosoma theileri]ORC92132.1 hypothetical protein TM35_000043460 [Trypanosoma theileri]
MYRLPTLVQLHGWQRQLRFIASHEMGSRIQQEVQQAIHRFRSKSNTPWVAISRVSSVLQEDTREALAELGGLAGFCRQAPQEFGNTSFVVKMVDGVLCVKLKNEEVKKPQKTYTNKIPRVDTKERDSKFFQICSKLPETPVTIETCQRVWELPTVESAVEQLYHVMEEIETLLKSFSLEIQMSLYIQLVYFGKRVAIVVRGPRTMLTSNHNTTLENSGPHWELEDFAPHYDLWRLSRFLRTDDFIPCSELIRQTTGILQTSLLQVALTYPERISLQLGPAIHLDMAEDNRFYLNGALRNEIHEIIGMKFILSEEEISKHLSRTSSKLSNLSDKELYEERMKLKELMPMRRQKLRRSIVREEFKRKFPKGNPFLNPDVVAFHLYDSLSPGVWMNNAMVRELLLPAGGKDSMHVGVDFFDQYPHLFITQGITSTSVNVMRREQGMEDVHSDGDSWKNAIFTDEDILLLLLPRLTSKRDDWGDVKVIEVLLAMLPRHVLKNMQQRGCAKNRLVTILRQYPEAFEVQTTETESDVKEEKQLKVRLISEGIVKLGVQLVNKMQVPGDHKIISGENQKQGDGDHDGDDVGNNNDDDHHDGANNSGAAKE